MIILYKIVVTTILLLGSIVFFSNSVPALITNIKRNPQDFWSGKLIMASAILNLLMIILFALLMFDNMFAKNENPSYEIITTPVYKQIK